MKSIYLLLGLVGFSLFACDKASELPLDGVPASVTELISDNCFCDPRIGLFRWEDRLLYAHWIAGPACNGIPRLFDGKGNPVELTSDEWNAFWEEKELVKMIWVCGE